MAKIDTQLKERLLASGRWPDFVRRRDDLRASGKTPGDANKIATAEFSEVAAIEVPKAGEGSIAPVATLPTDISMKAYLCERDDFGGRECGQAEQVLWVARNMGFLDVQKSDCPDPAAWFLLMACRESLSFRVDVFWKNIFTKGIPSKVKEPEEQDENKFDGKELVSLCGVLLDCATKRDEEGI